MHLIQPKVNVKLKIKKIEQIIQVQQSRNTHSHNQEVKQTEEEIKTDLKNI